MSGIRLLKGDCIELLKTLPDKSVDLILTDPPYEYQNGGGGSSSLGSRAGKRNDDIEFISYSFDMNTVFNEFIRVCKIPNMLIFCSNRQISKIMGWFENYDKNLSVTLLTWVKTNPIPTANNCYLSDLEFCIHVKGSGATINNDVPFDYKRKAYISKLVTIDRFHPAQKPDELLKRYLMVHSNENDVVLDCFMGSGSTGVMCKKLNRNFIGIEITDKYFDIAQKRINGTYKDNKLF